MHFRKCGPFSFPGYQVRYAALCILLLLALPCISALEPPLPAYGIDREADGFSLPADPMVLAGADRSPSPPTPVSGFADRALILCWHTFLGDPTIPTDFSLADLRTQLDALKALGYGFVDLDDLLAGRVSGAMNLVATIDDGHQSVPRAVESVFLPRGIRPALFIYPSVIGTMSYSMDDAAVQRLEAEGCRIGAHGYHHLRVNEALYRSDRAMFDKEIYLAKAKVEAIARASTLLYAYPFGVSSPITLAEVARAGYSNGFSVRLGFVYAEASLNDPYDLPRFVVTRENWSEIYAFLSRNAEEARKAISLVSLASGPGTGK
jgi:peptidoglycan/xylan/chitin deacetylase (PgdA/CDA1 family)